MSDLIQIQCFAKSYLGLVKQKIRYRSICKANIFENFKICIILFFSVPIVLGKSKSLLPLSQGDASIKAKPIGQSGANHRDGSRHHYQRKECWPLVHFVRLPLLPPSFRSICLPHLIKQGCGSAFISSVLRIRVRMDPDLAKSVRADKKNGEFWTFCIVVLQYGIENGKWMLDSSF